MVDMDEREQILQTEISRLAGQGWYVTMQGRYYVQMERQRRTLAQTLMIIGGLLTFIIPGLIMAAFIGKGKITRLYIEVTLNGKIKRRKQG